MTFGVAVLDAESIGSGILRLVAYLQRLKMHGVESQSVIVEGKC
jgi:hypothetical protein